MTGYEIMTYGILIISIIVAIVGVVILINGKIKNGGKIKTGRIFMHIVLLLLTFGIGNIIYELILFVVRKQKNKGNKRNESTA
jgi:hypothetical protein